MTIDSRVMRRTKGCWSVLLVVLWDLCVMLHALRYVAPEDCHWESAGDDGVALTCNLRTINGAFDNTNFSLIQAEHTVKLTLRCEDILFESSLANNSFDHLRELRSLIIEQCKLQDLPPLVFSGLSELRNLTVRTHNTEWGEFSLNLQQESFAQLRHLESLDLSHNNMASLPQGLLCPLRQLNFLNITHNDFPDVPSIGFSLGNWGRASCQVDVRQLDLSYNRIKVLPDKGLAAAKNLHELVLRFNLIGKAEEMAFYGLSKVQILDLSHNMIVALPPPVLRPCESLVELYLKNNSISVLPPGLFSGLQQMQTLDLSYNEITSHWLSSDTFADLIRLVTLDLSHNRLTHIDSLIFRSQYSLQILQLHHNEIQSISDNAFSSLYKLNTLVMTHNHLTRIDSLTLSGLYVLNVLTLDHNSLQYVHHDAFRNTSVLMELTVSGNRMTSVPYAVQSLLLLRSLDLSDNLIVDIHNASYQGLEHLYSLVLSGNRIGNLTKGVFEDLPSLRILSLANNRIQYVEQGTFDDVLYLHAVRLDSNYLTDVNGLFSNLHDLLMLNISANRIAWFDYALIPIGLQWLDLHENQIEILGNYFELEAVLKLRTLDASFNRITEIDSSSLPNGIEIVFINNNNIKTIHPFTFMGKPNLTRVDLTRNNLESLEVNAFRLTEVRNRRPLPEFSISENPYLCDCNMEWIQRIGSLDESRQYPRMVDLEDIVCQLSFNRRQTAVSLVKAHSSQFLCRYRSHCFALCHCCEFDACDCEMVCPENCTCYYDQSWNTNIVDCSVQSHTSVPTRIPMDVTELYLDGNDILSLSSHTFIGRKNMRVLYLNNSNVHVINNRTFNGLKSLQILHLHHNRLSVLHGYEFERLTNLKELYLSHNHLTTIGNLTFAPLKALEILHLDRNFIIEFQVWQLSQNHRLTDIQLSNNPWACECQFVGDFSEWLQYHGDYVRDLYAVQCVYNDTMTLPLMEFNMTKCTNFSATTYVQEYQVQEFMPLLIVISSLFILLLFVIVLIFVYRKEMSVWLYARYGVRIFRTRMEEEKLFDAFVSYSKKDEVFVTQILAPELECGNLPYRLCLHYRDLPVGGYLSDAIIEAMESSRRTVVILSENFLRSEWCHYEFKSAHHEVIRTCKHKLIVILLGRLAQRDLDPDIRLWLKTNTFLRWGDKRFWEKLRYAMPDVRHRKTERCRNDVSVAVHI